MLNCCRLLWGQLETGHSQTCKHARIILQNVGPSIFACNYIVGCWVRCQKLKFRFIRVCMTSSGTMRFSWICYLFYYFVFPDRGSVLKISQPSGISQPCLYSEMEVYPVSVQWNFARTTAFTFQAAICQERRVQVLLLQLHQQTKLLLFKAVCRRG